MDCGFTGAHQDVVGSSGILDKSVNGGFTKGRVLPSKVDMLATHTKKKTA